MIGIDTKYLSSRQREQSFILDRRTRLMAVTQFVLLFGVTLFLYRAISWDITPRIISLSMVVIMLSISVITRLQNKIELSVNLILSCVSAASVVAICTSGGPGNVATGWLLVCLCLSALLGSKKTCQFWSGLLLCTLLALVAGEFSGYSWPDLTPEYAQVRQTRFHVIAQMGALFLILLSFVREFERYETRHEIQLSTIEKEIARTKLAEIQAKNANLTKTRFLVDINHKLRTPLNSVVGYSKRLRSRSIDLSEREQNALDAIYRNSKVLLNSVNEILEFANLDENAIRLNLQNFDLASLVQELARESNETKDSTKHKIQIGSLNKFAMLGDLPRLRQALSRILNFCAEEYEQGPINMNLDMIGHLEESAHLSIQFQCHRLSVEQVNSMFTIDGQSAETNIAQNNTGLGLAIAYRLIDMHEGKLSVSDLGANGLCFNINLYAFPARTGEILEQK